MDIIRISILYARYTMCFRQSPKRFSQNIIRAQCARCPGSFEIQTRNAAKNQKNPGTRTLRRRILAV